MKRLGLIILFVLASGGQLPADEKPADAPKPYPLQFCIVSREHLVAGEIVNYVYRQEGKPDRAMKFCCRKCLARFKADPERFIKELDETAAKLAKKE